MATKNSNAFYYVSDRRLFLDPAWAGLAGWGHFNRDRNVPKFARGQKFAAGDRQHQKKNSKIRFEKCVCEK